MRKSAKGIGLAIVGAGRVGAVSRRGRGAIRRSSGSASPSLTGNRGGDVARIGADFVTTDHRELLRRPEVTCALIATDEHLHVDPIMAAVSAACRC
jgi:predicted dehydrogenase